MELEPTAFVVKHVRIVVIGAGISGIQFVKDVSTRLQNIHIQVYDKNDQEGGTWAENRYPGCACDIPSHTYQYSWNPNTKWSHMYAEASEILNYLQSTVDKFDLRQYMEFNVHCTGAVWDEDSSEWIVSLKKSGHPDQSFETRCDIFVYAVGRLNNWKLPIIKGLDRFQGPVVHTANWPDTFSVQGKDIAVIGNGASSVQCLAAISKDVKSVSNYIRGPTWLVPHVFSRNGDPQVTYPKKLIERFDHDPEFYFQFRLQIEKQLAGSFPGLWLNTKAAERFTSLAEGHMRSKIKDPTDLNALLPTNYKAGCRRFTPADRYMEALNQPNVELIASQIKSVEGRFIYTEDGRSRQYDAIVCGTGFQPYTPRFPVIGRGGVKLSTCWSDQGGYESYLAVTVAEFPNLFTFNPPICPVNGSAYPGIERASEYMINVIKRLQKDRLKSFCVTSSAQRAFNRWVQARMNEMVWSEACSSWYKLPNGKVIVPWPGTILHYYAATDIVRWEDYELRFENDDDKFASFGNGVTLEGFAPTDLPWLSRARNT